VGWVGGTKKVGCSLFEIRGVGAEWEEVWEGEKLGEGEVVVWCRDCVPMSSLSEKSFEFKGLRDSPAKPLEYSHQRIHKRTYIHKARDHASKRPLPLASSHIDTLYMCTRRSGTSRTCKTSVCSRTHPQFGPSLGSSCQKKTPASRI
jgi:hypothetical protein